MESVGVVPDGDAILVPGIGGLELMVDEEGHSEKVSATWKTTVDEATKELPQ